MSHTLTLKDGTVINKGDRIYLRSRSYMFVEKDETSECINMGDTGNFTFICNVKDGILVSNPDVAGTIFVYTGPDRITPNGLHMRKPEITLPKTRKIKGVKRRKKTPHPDVVAEKEKKKQQKKIGESIPRKRGRPLGSRNKKKRV